LEDAHHGCVNTGCIAGSKRHDVEAVLKQVGCKKRKLLSVGGVDGDLVETSAAVKTDKPKLTVGIAEVIQGIVAAGNGVFERQGNGVELAVADAHSPNEVVDVSDRFLMRLGGKN
jgi:hypothetical protein